MEKLTSVINEDMILESNSMKIDDDNEAIRQKEAKIKVEFERQMDDIKNNAKLIADAHNRQMNEIQDEKEQIELEKRRIEHQLNRIQR